jgi:hypothetical protein
VNYLVVILMVKLWIKSKDYKISAIQYVFHPSRIQKYLDEGMEWKIWIILYKN